MKKSTIFWVSYSDLMTSMFFLMLVFAAAVIGYLLYQNRIIGERLEEMKSIDEALGSLDEAYFIYDKENKRYKLKSDAIFSSDSDLIETISEDERTQLKEAGNEILKKVGEWIKENPNVYYLLIIEGNTQRVNGNWEKNPDGGYRLSYRRSLALYNFWKENDIDFSQLGNKCEVILAGSGYFSLSRVSGESDMDNNVKDPDINRRFTIQITAKWKTSPETIKNGKLIN